MAMECEASWDPKSAQSWASAVGLVPVRLFGGEAGPIEADLLLDGKSGSFALVRVEDLDDALSSDIMAYIWSANVRHALVIPGGMDSGLIRGWDRRDHLRSFDVPGGYAAVSVVLSRLEQSPEPTRTDVISHTLRAFRRLRQSLRSEYTELDVLQAFNGLVSAAEVAQENESARAEFALARRFSDIVALLKNTGSSMADSNWATSLLSKPIADLNTFLLDPEPSTGCTLYPGLLLRHGSGELYQEAHLVIERNPQPSLPGMESGLFESGTLRRDVRFTPPVLARSLVQLTLDALDLHNMETLSALDPACGSGVFLIELLRELNLRGFAGTVKLYALDVSQVSAEMARFCLDRAAKDVPFDVHVSARAQNSLHAETTWPNVDVVLMNPPFIPYQRMTEDEKAAVAHTLGDLNQNRPDMGMAFVNKAFEALKAGGAMASVVPAPYFSTASAFQWRRRLQDHGKLTVLGRFRGYGFFRASTVEPGFFVLSKPTDQGRDSEPIITVVAEPGAEESSLRALRLGESRQSEFPGVVVSVVDYHSLTPTDWTPRSDSAFKGILPLIQRVVGTRIADVFDVHLGIRSGNDAVFRVSRDELRQFGKKERRFFRPLATNETIRFGQIDESEYVFFPYDSSGPMLCAEDDVAAAVPVFYATRLKPNRTELLRRYGVSESTWWLLSRPRQWQFTKAPKIVSAAFGGAGRFAYDRVGAFVVGQGQAWILKALKTSSTFDEVNFAYLALLNSEVFEFLLASHAPKLQGGQFDLAKRHVDSIPMPDLAGPSVASADLDRLVSYGKEIETSQMRAFAELSIVAARVMGFEWREDLAAND